MSNIERPKWPTLDEARQMTTEELAVVRAEAKQAVNSISLALSIEREEEDPDWRIRAQTALKHAQRASGTCRAALAERVARQDAGRSAAAAVGYVEAGRSLKSVTKLLGLTQRLHEAVGDFLKDDTDEAFDAMADAWGELNKVVAS